MKKLMLLCPLLFMGSVVSAASPVLAREGSKTCNFSIVSVSADVLLSYALGKAPIVSMGDYVQRCSMIPLIEEHSEEETFIIHVPSLPMEETFLKFVEATANIFSTWVVIRYKSSDASPCYIEKRLGLGTYFQVAFDGLSVLADSGDLASVTIILSDIPREALLEDLKKRFHALMLSTYGAPSVSRAEVRGSIDNIKCCGFCNSSDKTVSRCTGCLQKRYCSRKCQLLDWRAGHKEWCKANSAQEKK